MSISNQPYERNELSVGDWILTLVILGIPLVNIVMYFYWALSSSAHPSRRNFARASLILFAIGVVLYLLFFLIVGVGSASMSPN